MIRKYNYTGRQKIAKDRLRILQFEKSGTRSFEVNLNVSDLGFPEHAKIYIEPYFKSSFMRFDFGTVARQIIPSDTVLNDIPVSDRILYRIKIVDESDKRGLILGFADEILPIIGDSDGGKTPLLPVSFCELGKRIWKLDMQDDVPVLSVNHDIPKIRELVSNDLRFFSLVYPEIIRQIAFKIVDDEEFNFDEEGDGWEYQWAEYFKTVLYITNRPNTKDEKEKEQWADDISEAFCRKHGAINLLTK